MNIYATLHARIVQTLKPLAQNSGLDVETAAHRFVVEPPRDPSHGDLASNVAMVLCKDLQMPPRALAEQIALGLKGDALLSSIEIAGPGFINFRLNPTVWFEFLRTLLQDKAKAVQPNLGKRQKINIEYVSANPTGPMHVGHGRGAVYGQALANLLAFCGFDVTREYYINDAGSQVDVLARSTYLRYREVLGENIGDIPEGLYPGDYLVAVGEALAKAQGNMMMGMPEEHWIELFRKKAIEMMMASIRDDLALLNIRHDVFFSERSLINSKKDCVAAAIDDLRAKGVVYEGVLPRPKGTDDEEWEEREQTLFASTRFGDDVDRALLKSDGGYTYFASDIAYHYEKYTRGFTHMIDVWGADHGGYVKRMQSAVKAISDGKARLDVELCQLVRLMRNGEVVKMSKRSGDFVTLREVVEEVGADAVCFMMLMRKQDAALDFDLVKVREQSKDNPVFYVQYAHARCHSTLRQALSAGHNSATANLELLTDEGEMGLIQYLAQFSRVVEQAVLAREPHRVAFYLFDLASHFHAQWNKGKDFPELRFVSVDAPKTAARLALVEAIAFVLQTGLGLLGVSAPEEMR